MSELGRTFARFGRLRGPRFADRCEPYHRWANTLRAAGMWPYQSVHTVPPGPQASFTDPAGVMVEGGINLTSQDYLSLGRHPQVVSAVRAALEEYGTHSAGSEPLGGRSSESLELGRRLAAHLQAGDDVVLFPTGWAAGYGSIAGLLADTDHAVVDEFAHACLREGAASATRNVQFTRHLDLGHVEETLRKLRATDGKNGVLVVTEGLFSMDADMPDLAGLFRLVRDFDAALLVDVAHDFGATGPGGGGELAAQGLLGKADLVVGAFSKTFATNGGFVAAANPAVRDYLRCFATTTRASNAPSPLQVAAAKAAAEVVQSAEGERLRDRLRENVVGLRAGLEDGGVRCLGKPAPFVIVGCPSIELGRRLAGELFRRGVFVSFVEFPAVPIRARGSASRLWPGTPRTTSPVRRPPSWR